MPPPTQEQLELFTSTFESVPFKPSLPAKYPFLPTSIDTVPEADARGYRRAEGYKAVWEGYVEPGWANYNGSLHGAAAAWLVDSCTSATLVGLYTDTFWGPPMLGGVSIALNMEYFHPAMVDTKIRIEVEIVKITAALANLKCEIRDVESGKLYCSGTHIKAWRPGRNTSKL